MRKTAATALTVLLVAAACTSAAEPSTTSSPGLCSDPPSDELTFDSDFELSLDPNPVEAGGEATLSVNLEGPPNDYIGGAGASWECWDGTSWIETHIVVRAFNVSAQPSVIDLSDDADAAIPDIGLLVPNSYQILVPNVTPGNYRITDHIFGPESTLTAHVAVEVMR